MTPGTFTTMKTNKLIRLGTALSATLIGLALQVSAATKVIVGHDLWIGYSGVFIAQEKGYFKEAGLDVELKPFSNPGETLPAMAAGKLDIGLTTLQNLVLLNGTSETTAVTIGLIDASNGADAIVGKSSIKGLADLKGKKVGATIGEVNHFLLLVGLEKVGLKESDIVLTNMSADDAGAAFVAGQIDAAVTWEPWVTKAKSAGGHTVFTSAEIPDTIMDCIAVPKASVESKRATYTAFMAAIDKGVAYLRKSPDEAYPLIAKYLGASNEDVKGMLEGDKVYALADNRALIGSSGTSAPIYSTLGRIVSFTKSKGLIQREVDPIAIVDPSIVRSTKP
jgi:NitT/TauT family transport system substrate-binding protein